MGKRTWWGGSRMGGAEWWCDGGGVGGEVQMGGLCMCVFLFSTQL